MNDGSSLNTSQSYHIGYSIPRQIIGSKSGNVTSGNGQLHLTAGSTKVMDFVVQGDQRKPINLSPFTIKVIFWQNSRFDLNHPVDLINTEDAYDIVLTKHIVPSEPYNGKFTLVVNQDDVEIISNKSENAGVRWGVYLINDANEIFAMHLSNNGSTYGQVTVTAGGTPTASIILGA